MPDFTFVLAGKIGVGKTTIFRRIQVGHFVETAMSENEEIEHCLYKAKIKDNDFKINLWDTGGLERYHSEMTGSYFHYAHAVILVYDASTDDLSSLFALKDWIAEARRSSNFKERVILSLWGNKSDLAPPNSRVSEEVKLFMRNYSIPESLHFFVSSISEDNRVVDCLHKVVEYVYESTCGGGPPQLHASLSPEPSSASVAVLRQFCCC